MYHRLRETEHETTSRTYAILVFRYYRTEIQYQKAMSLLKAIGVLSVALTFIAMILRLDHWVYVPFICTVASLLAVDFIGMKISFLGYFRTVYHRHLSKLSERHLQNLQGSQ
jgi:hypothetical protein